MNSVRVLLMGIDTPHFIFSVRVIHLIQKIWGQIEHLINSHVSQPVYPQFANCQYSANGEELVTQDKKKGAEKEGKD